MNYDVFISYSMSLSSRAYELSAQLSRENMMCYLDCMESGYTLGDYTRTILEESRVYVLLADTLPASPYATALLQCVTGITKPILVCLTSGNALPDTLRERCTVTTDASLLEDILCLLRDEEEEEESDSDFGLAPLRSDASLTTLVPLEVGTVPSDSFIAESKPSNSEAMDCKLSDYKPIECDTADEGTKEHYPAQSLFKGDERSEALAERSGGGREFTPTFSVTPVYEDGTDGRQDDAFGTEHRGDIADFYEECRKGERSLGYDKVFDRQRNEAKLKELERDLLPDEPEEDEAEEASASESEGFGEKLFDFLEKNPRIGVALLIFLIGMLMSLLG